MSATMLKEASAPANAAETPIPTGIRLTPFHEAFRNDPYPVLKRLRDAEPIHGGEPLSRWFVTGFDQVREVLRNKDLSVNNGLALPESYAGRIASNAKMRWLRALPQPSRWTLWHEIAACRSQAMRATP
jgi:cytochrome P450